MLKFLFSELDRTTSANTESVLTKSALHFWFMLIFRQVCLEVYYEQGVLHFPLALCCCCSVAESDSLRLHGLQHISTLSTISQSLRKLRPIKWMMLSNHLALCRPLPLLLSIFPGIRVFPKLPQILYRACLPVSGTVLSISHY